MNYIVMSALIITTLVSITVNMFYIQSLLSQKERYVYYRVKNEHIEISKSVNGSTGEMIWEYFAPLTK